ncbi:MAG: hypothetical protein ACQEQI_04200, partial [Bacillota bacterium]
MTLFLIIVSIGLILILFCLIPVRVRTSYRHQAENQADNFIIAVEIWPGIITYRLHIPYLEVAKLFSGSLLRLKSKIEAVGSPDSQQQSNLRLRDLKFKELIKELKLVANLTDDFKAVEKILTTFQDELIKLDQLTLSNPILLRIISTLLLSIEG